MQQESINHPEVARQKLERGQVGIAGEYAVLWKLIENGFAAARTDGNSKDLDVLCSDIATGKVNNVQVKTLNPDTDYSTKDRERFIFRIANRSNYEDMLDAKCETILKKRIYYIFCALESSQHQYREKTRFFVATPEEVVRQIKERVKKRTTIIDFVLYGNADGITDSEDGWGLISDYEDELDKLRD